MVLNLVGHSNAKDPTGFSRLKGALNISYTYVVDLKQKRKMRMRFVYGFPGDNYMTRNDPLRDFRESPWLSSIQKRKLRKGMPERALILSWGQPLSVQSSTSATGTKKIYGYGGHSVTLKEGIVISWERPRR